MAMGGTSGSTGKGGAQPTYQQTQQQAQPAANGGTQQSNVPVNPYEQASQGQQQAFGNVYGALQNNSNMMNNLQYMQPAYMQGNYGYDPNTIRQSAGYDANTMKQSAGYDPRMMQNAAGYDPNRIRQSAGYDARMMQNAAGYDANTLQGDAAGYRAVTQDQPRTMASMMDRYMNPYQQQVVDRTQDQLEKQRLQMQEGNRANAAAAGAFGGSRHGLTEATTNAEISQQMGDLTANLNRQGFLDANQLAGQDISNRMQVSAQNQAAQNQARQFGAGNQQQQNLANQTAMNQAAQFGASNLQQMRLANQAAENQQRQYNATNNQQQKVLNQAAANQADQFNAGNLQQMRLANQGAANQARQFNASNEQQQKVLNQAARNQADQYNATNNQQQKALNQAARNQAGQFNANQAFNVGANNQASANMANQYNAGMYNNMLNQQFQNALQGAGTLANLSGNSFNMGNSITANQMNAGNMAQQQNQALMDQARQMYEQYASQPQNILQMRLASLGMNPLNNAGTTTQNTQSNPGWGSMFGNLLGAAGNMLEFSPIALPFSDITTKDNIEYTGEVAITNSGNTVPIITFNYKEEYGDPNVRHKGVIAQDLVALDDPAAVKDGDLWKVDYSQVSMS